MEEPSNQLTRFFARPLDTSLLEVLSTTPREIAYSCRKENFGNHSSRDEAIAKMKSLEQHADTLGFEIETDEDMYPFRLDAYSKDGEPISTYEWGGHSAEGSKYNEKSFFSIGEKVLCKISEGYDAIFPAVIVGPITPEYIKEIYEQDDLAKYHYETAEDFVADWEDWCWDYVVVRPLVRLKCECDVMKETVLVPRTSIYPYHRFDVK